MFNEASQSIPKLQPAGAGLPRIELAIARVLVGVKLRITSFASACETFTVEKDKVLSLVSSVSPEQASKRVLIERLRGLEDSSRYWSLYMTLEHLRIVNQFTSDVIQSLIIGEKPSVVVSTASVKPSETTDQSVVQKFKSVCEEFERNFPASRALRSTVTLAHPWFGELNARQWHFFAGFHMALHRTQMVKIIEKLRSDS